MEVGEIREINTHPMAFMQCEEFLGAMPNVKLVETEGTYLLWLDFRELKLSGSELEELIIKKAKLWLDSGHIFGSEYDQFQRIVIACPRATLEEALKRIEKSIAI